jgi:hypothetical protein
MIGDFNEAMWSFDHLSSHRRPEKQMLEFREVLSQCDLHDTGFSGLSWTYDNKQKGDRNVRVRLDRAVASPNWSLWFPDSKVQHLVSSRSDHCPIFLNLEHDQIGRPTRRTPRYEIKWEREDSLPGEIRASRDAAAPCQNLGDVAITLSKVMTALRRWSFDKFGAVTKELEILRAKIEELSTQDHIANQDEVDKLNKSMDELLYREEMMWLQRSRISWLKEGDRNTTFFIGNQRAEQRKTE